MNKISVITVCYNESKEKIQNTFESILKQNYKPIEFIVIDGGSNKKTLESIQPYIRQIDHFISESDNGIFDAMNKGLSLATGSWICFMNVGDTFYKSSVLSSLMNSNYGNSEILYGDVYKTNYGLIESPAKLNKYVFYDTGICHQAMLARKSVFQKIGSFDLNTNLYGDADLIMKAHIDGVRFFHVPEIICTYEGGGATSHNASLSRDRRNYLIKYYSYDERITYYIRSLFNRIVYRIIRFDLRMPYYLKNLLKRPGS